MKYLIILCTFSLLSAAAKQPSFSTINRKYSNLHSLQIRCAVDMTNDSQTSLRTESHVVVFGKNTSHVLTSPEKPSARLLKSLLHNLAPVMLRNLLPDAMQTDFRWKGTDLVHRYKYKGIPSENTYTFGPGLKLDAIEIRTNDGISQVKMEFTWELVDGKYRLTRFINNQYRHEAHWDMQLTYDTESLAGFSVPNRILLTLQKDGRTMKHAYRFSACSLI